MRQLSLCTALWLLFIPLHAMAQDPAVVRSEMSINVRWYGALPNDGVDDTDEFRAAVAALGGGYGRIYVPRGNWDINDTIRIANDRIHVEGDGPWATTIRYTPSLGDQPAFEFGRTTTGVLYQNSLRKMSFYSANTSTKKIAVRLTDVSGFVLEDVAIGPVGGWTGSSSVGVQIRGRELGRLSRLTIAADLPVKVEKNPNYAGPLLDFDVWHFEDMELKAAATEYCITVDDGVSVTDFVMDGSNAFVTGEGGFYWNDTNTSPAGIAYGLTIRNTRSENLTGGYMVYVNTVRGIRRVTLDNVSGGASASWNGFYFRGVRYLQLINCMYTGTGTGAIGLDMDNIFSASMLNCFWNKQSVRNTGDMRRLFAVNQGFDGGVNAGYTTEFWETSLNDTVAKGLATRFGGATAGATGANLIGGSGTLAAGSSELIPTLNGSANVVFVQVWSKGTTRSEGGIVMITSLGAYKFGGTANFDVGSGANKLTVDGSSWSDVRLRNNTGEQLTYGFTVWWN